MPKRRNSAPRVFNSFEFYGWTIIFFFVFIKIFILNNFYYHDLQPLVKLLQLLQYIEVIFSLSGVTKGNQWISFLQTTGRCITVFLIFENNPDESLIFFVLLCWSSAEAIRYSAISLGSDEFRARIVDNPKIRLLHENRQ